MVLELSKDGHALMCDNKPILEKFKLIIPKEKNQLRLRFDTNVNDKITSFDIVVYSYTIPKLDIGSCGISMNIIGEEYITHTPFRGELSVNLIKKTIRFTGLWNQKQIELQLKSADDIPAVLKKLQLNTINQK